MKKIILFIILCILQPALFAQIGTVKIDPGTKNIKISPEKIKLQPPERKSIISNQIKASGINNRTDLIPAKMATNSDGIINQTLSPLADINLTLYTGTGYVLSFEPKTLKQGETFTSNFSVVNWGSATSGIFKVYVVLSADKIYSLTSDYKAGELTVQSIDAGFYKNLTVSCTAPSTTPAGTYYVYMVIDAAAVVAETNETDNLWYYESQMTVQSLVNDVNVAFYTGTGAINSYTPHTLVPGGAFTANIAVQNTGTAASGEFKVSVGISTDQIFHFTDPECGSMMASSINGGFYRNISINCILPSDQAAGTYYIVIYLDDLYSITETNEADNSNFYSDLATVINDFDPPNITHTTVKSATYNSPVTVSATATDISGIKDFYLLYRKSGESTWDPLNSANFINNQATIPASFVTEKGVDYKIYAADNYNNYANWINNADGYVYFVSIPVSVPVDKISGFTTKGGSNYTSYELISTPYKFGSLTASDILKGIGTYKKNWRIMTLIGSDKFADGETSSIENGKAYFLITDKSTAIKAPSAGTTEPISYYYGQGTPINSGWSLVGNPFPFVIPVQYMFLYNSTTLAFSNPEAWSYQGTQGWVSATNLNPWQGLAVYSSTATKLFYCLGWTPTMQKSESKSKENSPVLSFNKSESKLINSGNNWYTQIVVKGEKMWDQENFFGMQESASATKDDFDKLEPPIIEEGTAAYFPHLDWKEGANLYHRDIQPVNANGGVWNFVIQSPQSENIDLEFKGLENIPDAFNKYLFDLDHQTSYNLSVSGKVKITGGIGKRNLLIVIGNNSFIEEKSGNIKLTPEKFVLNQNYPNPFNPSTVISFSLPNKSNVNLTLLDLNGKIVKTLINEEKNEGFHEVSLNAASLSSGVYYYRLQANGIKSFTDIKKMILVK